MPKLSGAFDVQPESVDSVPRSLLVVLGAKKIATHSRTKKAKTKAHTDRKKGGKSKQLVKKRSKGRQRSSSSDEEDELSSIPELGDGESEHSKESSTDSSEEDF